MADKKYVLLKWKDGWQEVVAVEGDTVDFNKYYVVERVEHVGRLVFNRPKGQYPQLILVDRAPTEIEGVALVDGNGEGTLKQTSTYREGSRLEYNYALQKGEGGLVGNVLDSIRRALAERKASAKDVLSKADPEKGQELAAIAKAARIVGQKSQTDLVGFMEEMLKKL